jgi:hypothetical protein
MSDRESYSEYDDPAPVERDEMARLRDDAARYRKIMAIRGQHIGVPCACQFADDDETLLKTCNSHRDLFAAKDAEIARLRDALHRISLGAANSGTTKEALGKEARAAINAARKDTK